MTKLRYSSGGGAAIRQPCAVCTGAAHECSTEPAKQLPILGGRHTHNDERNHPGTALAGDDMGANHRLYAAGSGQHAPGGKHGRRVGDYADCGAAGTSRTLSARWKRKRKRNNKICSVCRINKCRELAGNYCLHAHFDLRRRPTHAHREQVHGCVYVPTHRLTPKGVAL